MPHESEGKAMLCYHKSADGRCLHFGPACQTKVVMPAEKKLLTPVSTQVVATPLKK